MAVLWSSLSLGLLSVRRFFVREIGVLGLRLQIGHEPVHLFIPGLPKPDPVGLPRVDEPVEILSGLEQGIDELHHMGGMDVVIDRSVLDQELSLQVLDIVERVGFLVALGIVLGKSHVPLGIDGVIVPPVDAGGPGHRNVEFIRRLQQGHDGHVAAVGDSGDADAARIHIGTLGEVGHRGHQVLYVGLPQLPVARRLEFLAPAEKRQNQSDLCAFIPGEDYVWRRAFQYDRRS